MKELTIALVLLAGFLGITQTALAAQPLTYAQCIRMELTDNACHRRIASAGGTSRSAPRTAQDVMVVEEPDPDSNENTEPVIVIKDPDGKTAKDRWYDQYVLYARDYGARVEPKSVALRYYPNYPPMRPAYGFR